MQKTKPIYGARPVDLGLIDLSPTEMMFWLYCPIKVPASEFFYLPPNLKQFEPLVLAAMKDALESRSWHGHYAYITAKTLFSTPEKPGNRPGWHSDGFLTEDINYIWCDANPTVFWGSNKKYAFSAHHEFSLSEMEELCEKDKPNHFTLPVKHLLRLDQTVLHKVSTDITPGVRTFVKISVSKYQYALLGNSVNHELQLPWVYQDRKNVRNCPIGSKK